MKGRIQGNMFVGKMITRMTRDQPSVQWEYISKLVYYTTFFFFLNLT